MEPLPADPIVLTTDLFNGLSNLSPALGQWRPDGPQLQFTTQIVVPCEGEYTFDYAMSSILLADDCWEDSLGNGLCVHCVYELDILLTDACGATTILQQGLVGQVDLASEAVMFACTATTMDPPAAAHWLSEGEYTLTKVLRIHDPARDYYVERLIDPDYNNCVHDFNYFYDLLEGEVDLNDCTVDCADCYTALGPLEDYLLNNPESNEAEYYAYLTFCDEMCAEESWCQVAYRNMLTDMSRQGQYCKYELDANQNVVVTDRTSVLFEGTPAQRILARPYWNNTTPAYRAIDENERLWKQPWFEEPDGSTHQEYRDQNGTRTRVWLVDLGGGNYEPAVDPGAAEFDPVAQLWFAYPEELVDVTDFINVAWQPGFERSLVRFHPEYCYYMDCKSYGPVNTQPGVIVTSDDFDARLKTVTSLAEAVSQGFIIGGGTVTSVELWNVDPFVASADDWALDLQHTCVNFSEINGSFYDVGQVALTIVRCLGNINGPTCTDISTITVASSEGDAWWIRVRDMYLSRKYIVQKNRANAYVNSCDCPSLNYCIGEEETSTWWNKMGAPFAYTWNWWGSNSFWNYLTNWYQQPRNLWCQVCSHHSYHYFDDKVRRFEEPSQIPGSDMSAADAAYQVFLTTGQCPLGSAWQQFLNEIVTHPRFLTANDQDSLEQSGAWTAVQFALNDLQGAPPVVPGEIQADVNSVTNQLIIGIDEGWDMSLECTVTLEPPSLLFDWSSIVYVANITEQVPAGHFRIGVYYLDADGVTQLVEIDGVMCEQYQLWPCNFPRTCEPNEFALHLQNLMTMLAYGTELESSNVVLSTAQVPGGGGTIQSEMHPSITGLFAASPTFQWSYVPGGPALVLRNTAQAGVSLRLEDLTTEPDAQPVGYYLAQAAMLLNITSNYENFFTVDLVDANGVFVATLSGALFWEEGGVRTPLPAGECDLPEPMSCQTMGHVSYANLLAVLEERLSRPGVDLNQLDLGQSPHITQDLVSALVPDCDDSWMNGGVSCLLGTWNNGTDTWTLGDCLELEFTGGWQVPIDAFGDAQFTGDPDQPSGAYHAFTVDLLVGNSVVGELRVSTCIDLMPCEPCPPDSGAMGGSGDGQGEAIAARYGLSDDELVEAGLVHQDLVWPKYLEYTTAVSGLNQRFGHIPGDSLYLAPADYAAFRTKGFQHILGSYLKYIDGFQPVADKKELLYQPEAFTVDYSGSVNVSEEYLSYQKAVEDYNARAAALGKPTIDPVPDSTFKQLLAADVSRLYVNDLVERYPSNTPPQGLVQYMAQQGTPTDPCTDIYTDQYLAAYAWLEAHNPDSTSRCPGYTIYTPLVSYEEFQGANLCCSDTGMAVLGAYLEQFYNDTLRCPGELPRLKLCPEDDEEAAAAKALIDDERECQRLYLLWLEALDKYHKPSAYYAHTHIDLPNHYSSFEEFMKAGLCECVEEYLAYLDAYLAWKEGMEPLPDAVTIEEFCDPNEDPCCVLFEAVQDAITAYHTSAYYEATHHGLGCELRSCEQFIEEGFCECAEAYLIYLQAYIDWTPIAPMPQNKPLCIKEWCQGYDPSECELLYLEYVQTLNSLQPVLHAYNVAHGTTFQFLYADASLFTPDALCYCVEAYLAHLAVVFADLDAHRDELEAGRILMLIRWCSSPVPCDPVLYPVIPQIQTTIDPDSGCIMDLLNALHLNATTWYDQYIDTLTQDITERYDSTCMQAFESFTMKFTDQEHHFTLYYYDQAGNLVRTVPPAGVALPAFTTSADPIAQRIANDRANGTHTYFTKHRMASDHLYNSLGQPTRSAMPDQDDMKIWEPSLTSGLPVWLQVTDSWFKPGGHGYLSGYRDLGTAGTRGYVYGTADGGATWHRKKGLLGLDLHDVHFPSTNVGYGVGDQGGLLRTADAGNTWDLRPVASLTHDIALRGVMFEGDDDGVMVGSKAGQAWSGHTADGGVTVTANLPSGYAAFTGIGWDGTSYWATATDITTPTDTNGAVLKWTGTQWADDGLRGRMASDHKAIAALGTNEVWLGGQRGVLLYSGNNGDSWRMVATGQKDDFLDLHVYTQNVAVAIMDSSNWGVLRATYDGGHTWEAVGKPHHDLNDFHAYDGSHLIAVGKNGQVVRVMMSTSNVVTTDLATLMTGITVEHTRVWTGMDGAAMRLIVGSADGTIRFCTNGNPATPGWAQTVTSVGTVAIKAMEGHVVSGSHVNMLAVNASDKRYDVKFPVAAAPATAGPVSDYEPHLAKGTSGTLVTVRTTNDLEVLDLATWPIPAPIANPWPATGSLADLTAMAVSDITLVQAGLAGAIQNAPSTTWSDQSRKVQPLRLYGITDDGKVAVGEEGLVYHNDGTQWNLIPSPAFDDLLDAAMRTPTEVYCAGEGSTVFLMNLTTPMAGVTGSTLPITTTVLSIAVDPSGARTLGTPDGSILYAAPGTGYIVLPFNGGAVNGLAPRPGTNDVMAVGGQSMVHRVMTSTRIAIDDVFTPRLNGIHFANGNDGYTVGDARIVRHTVDGGITWQAVPTSAVMPIAALHDVCSTAPGHAITVGDAIACSLDGLNAASIISGLSGKSLRGVAIAASGAGVIVGHNGGNGIYYRRNPGGTSWTSSAFGSRLNAVWSFPRYLDQDRFLLAGYGGNMIRTYWDQPSTGWDPSPLGNIATLVDPVNALFFHDHVAGYAVGNSGALARTSSTSTSIDFSALAWGPLQGGIDDGLAGQNALSNIDLTTIGFSDRYHGFYAGTYAPDQNFARIINDESGLFSQRCWYDALGRIVLSQNSKQRAPLTYNTPEPQRFSYSLYDGLGRVVEAGEVTEDNTDIFDVNGMKAQLGYEVGGVENPNVIDPNVLSTWVQGRTRKEVTRTYYDEAVTAFGLPSNYDQRNLRLRVASTTFQEEEDGVPETYDHATHYSYDIHGNVDDLLQDHPQMAIDLANDIQDPMRWKRMKYRYDLISGNVLQVKYQEGDADQFYHKYEYDADNRLIKVETSLDNTLYHTDAEYFYYPHGPLQRTELGEQKVQGMDYAYTLQGWLKGINSELLTPDNDMGLDGVVGGGNANELVGRDAYGLSLTYHGSDYRATDNARWDNSSAHRPFAPQAWAMPDWHPLYNGNIASTANSLQPFGVGGWQGTANEVGQVLAGLYRYDQLNRLRQMRTRAGLNDATNDWTTLPTPTGADADKYLSTYAYDANGNIEAADRYDQNGDHYDDLEYFYQKNGSDLVRNRLYHLKDHADATNAFVNEGPNGAVDLDYRQATFYPLVADINEDNNYRYDELGNLVQDLEEEIAKIDWTVAGKVKAVERTGGSNLPPLEFAYGAGNERTEKSMGTGADLIREHYVHDADGNVMAVYNCQPSTGNFTLREWSIYGSQRVGAYDRQVLFIPPPQVPQTQVPYDVNLKYEMKDHLGNVGAVVTARLLLGDGAPHEAEVVQAQVYEPFGSLLPGRNYGSSSYGYGFNGMRKDDEIHGETGTSYDFGARLYDPRVSRWLTTDPHAINYPYISPFAFALNTPIQATDPNGKWVIWVHYQITYDVLIKLGYSAKAADRVAHAASTYSDNPPDWVIKAQGHPEQLAKRPSIDYSVTRNSQEEDHSHWHAMRSDAEASGGMTPEQATQRGLEYGWGKIFACQGEALNALDLGQGLHALQDAEAHFGASTNEHLGLNLSSLWHVAYDSGKRGGDQLDGAKSLTESAVRVMEIMNGGTALLKDGVQLNLRGTSVEQRGQIRQMLGKSGFTMDDGSLVNIGTETDKNLVYRYTISKKKE
ncbi:MAG: hypothetical protein IT227_12655 [Flavobacteriales bacterium]|nr:hypothetical protein [Flavobacteriales bacterium]